MTWESNMVTELIIGYGEGISTEDVDYFDERPDL